MNYRLLALAWIFAGNTLLAQFESLAEKETAKDKLDNFFIQADNFSELFAVAFLRNTVTINQSNGSVTEATGSGLSVRSDEHQLKYFCLEYDAVFKPPTRGRMESFVVGKIERRRQTDGNKLREPAKVEPDPETGFRAELQKIDAFSSLGAEINPYGFILASRFPARGRNSAVEKVISNLMICYTLPTQSPARAEFQEQMTVLVREYKGDGEYFLESDSRANNNEVGLDLGELAYDGNPTPDMEAIMSEELEYRLALLGDNMLRAIAIYKMNDLRNQEIADKIGVGLRSVERKLLKIRQILGTARV